MFKNRNTNRGLGLCPFQTNGNADTVELCGTYLTKGNEILHFFYDAQSKPAMVEYNGAMYRYVHNLQGDIVGILDSTGALVVEYKYDAWGKPIATAGSLKTSLGELNPFRYRGYIYDEETALYYLQSRYFDSTSTRFINADKYLGQISGLGTHNSYAYCSNQPVSFCDPTGNHWVFALLYINALTSEKGQHYDFSKNEVFQSEFTKKVASSSLVKERVNEYINQMPKGSRSYTRTEAIYWPILGSIKKCSLADVDLGLSVGHINSFTLTIEKQQNDMVDNILNRGERYKVTYTISDHYDFESWEGRKISKIEIFINDTFGYDLQEAGVLNDYYYRVSGEFDYYH